MVKRYDVTSDAYDEELAIEREDGKWVKYEDYLAVQKKMSKFQGELVWIWSEVWPLIHGLTSRSAVRERFKKLPDLINE